MSLHKHAGLVAQGLLRVPLPWQMTLVAKLTLTALLFPLTICPMRGSLHLAQLLMIMTLLQLGPPKRPTRTCLLPESAGLTERLLIPMTCMLKANISVTIVMVTVRVLHYLSALPPWWQWLPKDVVTPLIICPKKHEKRENVNCFFSPQHV